MKKLVLPFVALAVLCASAVFAMPGEPVRYHQITADEYFSAVSYDSNVIGALSVGVKAMSDWPVELYRPMHWTEGTDDYGSYAMGSDTNVNSLANNTPLLYFSDYTGDMIVGNTTLNKSTTAAILGVPIGDRGDLWFEIWLKNTSDVPIVLTGDVVFAAANAFDYDAWEADEYGDNWEEYGFISSMAVMPGMLGYAYAYEISSGGYGLDPITVDTNDLDNVPDPEDWDTYSDTYIERYTDYILQPGEYAYWTLNGDSARYNVDTDLTGGNFFSLGINLRVTGIPEPQPTEIPEPTAFAYGALGLVSALGMKRRIRK